MADKDPSVLTLLKRAFYKPGAEPARFDLMRLMAIPLTIGGVGWMGLALYLDFIGRPMQTPWWAGAVVIGFGCAVYGISKISFGGHSVDFRDQP